MQRNNIKCFVREVQKTDRFKKIVRKREEMLERKLDKDRRFVRVGKLRKRCEEWRNKDIEMEVDWEVLY